MDKVSKLYKPKKENEWFRLQGGKEIKFHRPLDHNVKHTHDNVYIEDMVPNQASISWINLNNKPYGKSESNRLGENRKTSSL